ncbi:MAG: GNAT family N-acetyltransferase [Lysobacter sp.]|nr:GNAT family N-acetyltransferase [Lysobacter sp.]
MQPIEHRLAARYPRWFRGRRGRLVAPVVRTFARWIRLDLAEAIAARHRHLAGLPFVRAVLESLGADYRITAADLARIPARGRLLVVANHPAGALDALALLDAIGRVRQDVRIVANDVLGALEPLGALLLPVRVFGGGAGAASLKAIERALRAEQCVVVFPAGEVSRLGFGGVRDARWRSGFARFARACAAPVLPVRIFARNSALFYGLSTLFRPAGTVMLARELFERSRQAVLLRVGEPTQVEAGEDVASAQRRIRRVVYALKPDPTQSLAPAPVAAPTDPVAVREAMQALRVLGETADGMRIACGRLAADSPLLRELGRLRETTFRAVGEGTGRAVDLDDYDAHYEHIVVWDEAASRIAGAYRVARGARTLADHGLKGLYTAAFFDYGDDMLPRIAQGMELGRSFVAPEYWGSRSIDYLWQGIGAYLRAHPGVRYLFGAVSISAALPLAAREQIVAYYSRFYGGDTMDATSRRPFAYQAATPAFEALDADTGFRVLKANLAGMGAALPMLYKQYTELCEPGGARFLAFGVDPDFGDSIDGLIEVDLARMEPRKRRRYLQERTGADARAAA